MVAKSSQEGWIRACLAGLPGETLSFHPYCNFFSKRAQADTKAATVFLAKDTLNAHYQYAHGSPKTIIAGILTVRCDLLLSNCYCGVAANISKSLNSIPHIQQTEAQRVYRQLWAHSFDDKVDSDINPLSQQQCIEITQLLAQPIELANFLNGLIVDTVQNTRHAEPQFLAVADSDESEEVDNDANAETATTESTTSSPPNDLQEQSLPYQVFTRQYDQEMPAFNLAPQLIYGLLREKISHQLPQYDRLSRRLANKLRRELMSMQQHAWQEDLEEGYLHSAKLASLIASPTSVRPFKQEIQHPFPATAVTLLIDCSGSMQGEPLLMAAAWVDVLVEALELCQIKTEVLGFTTGHWDEGPVRKQWQGQGSNKSSGRLNDLLHVEFKRFDQVWKQARHGLAAVLQSQWQKENIDGEALDWAYQRLKSNQAKRKLLFVLSDAKPYDQLTVQNNGHSFLEQDLLRRVKKIEQQGLVELIGIGVGHRVCRIYPQSVQIKQLRELPQTMLDTLLEKLKVRSIR